MILTFRRAMPEDLPYVLTSWLASMARTDTGRKMGAHVAGAGGRDARTRLHRGWRPQVERLLRLAEVHIAETATEDGALIVGWACAEPPGVVHYVLTRRKLQRAGIAKRVVAHVLGEPIPSAVLYTHLPANRELVPEGWSFDPHAGLLAPPPPGP